MMLWETNFENAFRRAGKQTQVKHDEITIADYYRRAIQNSGRRAPNNSLLRSSFRINRDCHLEGK